jgi:hypothetical protein
MAESYEQKQFVEVNQDILDAVQNYSKGGFPGFKAYNYLRGKGFGDFSPQQINELIKNPEFVTSRGIGKAFSYQDLALEALQGDPNFNPEDTSLVSTFAKDLEKRGLKNTDREKISTLATQKSVGGQIDKAVNPGKYLNEEQRAANTAKASQLLASTYGEVFPDYAVDQNEADYIADLLAQGYKPYEIQQELRVGGRYMEGKAAKDREMINQELLKSEDEVFAKATPQIIGSYMRAGRLGSSGLNSALANARAELASQRQGALTGIAREDVVGARNTAFQNYLRQSEPGYQQRFNLQNAGNYANFQQPYNNLNRQYQLNDQATARRYEVEDYNTQRNDFLRYIKSQRGGGGLNVLSGAISGARAGASLGPWGALGGAALGAFSGSQGGY